MEGVFDAAILDFFNDKIQGPLVINNHYGPADEMPLDVYFRDEDSLNGLESYALTLCHGNILDVGAGVGALSLILQNRKIEVDSIELSDTCCRIMQQRGVSNILNQDFFNFESDKRYDSLLMMMNGFGISGTIDKLPQLFGCFDSLLKSDGQVLFDSSDVSYLYEEGLPKGTYFGELDYQYEYNNVKGEWFKWLYMDIETLAEEASKYGYQLQVLSEDSDGQYLGRLIRQ